tara:strand:- start:1690 stop:2400 length:711 start_codon:yes stop_codon:yes gene_type:complete
MRFSQISEDYQSPRDNHDVEYRIHDISRGKDFYTDNYIDCLRFISQLPDGGYGTVTTIYQTDNVNHDDDKQKWLHNESFESFYFAVGDAIDWKCVIQFDKIIKVGIRFGEILNDQFGYSELYQYVDNNHNNSDQYGDILIFNRSNENNRPPEKDVAGVTIDLDDAIKNKPPLTLNVEWSSPEIVDDNGRPHVVLEKLPYLYSSWAEILDIVKQETGYDYTLASDAEDGDAELIRVE